ncbi:hypothetical protein ASD83_00170 [Devosia sp. Root685]|uniref:hypothetical protein n=1 Tax=Devosia sp. Root685 TaxID=1736587 RepID=UPI0006F62E51|nr:hypothetical protein [Devosia sp. Root685]KRA98999.1 hypothetical protein ASD83_00170 [Devosia sp. Root685]
MKLSTLASAAIFLLPTAAFAADSTPADIGAIFCKASLEDDMSPFEAALTPDLSAVIAEAEAKNAEIQAATPNEKPPLGDGLPWRSWTDYADGCAVGTITEEAGKTLVEIRYSFTTSPDANYADHLVLIPATGNDSWQLDDINLIDGMTLRSVLAAAFAQ